MSVHKPFPSIPAVFVTSKISLNGASGGQQICTQEYLSILRAAGFDLKIISYEFDRRFSVRLKRRLRQRPYQDYLNPSLLKNILESIVKGEAKYIFLNVADTAPLAMLIRKRVGDKCRIVLLSHGLASVDFIHEIRSKSEGEAFSKTTSADYVKLSRQLVEECKQRQYIDHVFCLAPFEVEIERWLGAKGVTWLPRMIPDCRLDWQPKPSRLGFVGTMDHPPNMEGLILFLRELKEIAPPDVRLRVVGGPAEVAENIARRFQLVDYLGQLSDEDLATEVSTWNCLVHPLFCYARGCSTKLAIALGWHIPIVTTPAGCRGYMWSEGNLSIGDTPESLARLALTMLKPEIARDAQREVAAVVRSSPKKADVISQLWSALCPVRVEPTAELVND